MEEFLEKMERMGVVACEADWATFLKMHVFSVHDNNFKTFLS